MIQNELPEFPQYVDSSMVSEWTNCERAFYWHYIRWLNARGANVHLNAGGAFAKGVQTMREAFYQERLSQEQALARGITALLKAYGDFNLQDDSPSGKSWLRMAGALDYYTEVWPLDTEILIPVNLGGPGGKLGIECTFALPLEIKHPITGNPMLYAGRFDMLAEREGVMFVVDEKTTGQLGDSWSRKWDMRGQITGYIWASKQYGIPVSSAIIRGVSILKTIYGSAEVVAQRSQWEIDRWYEQLHKKLARMISTWQTGDYLYALGDACESYGGCSYKVLCRSHDPEPYVPVHFERSVWNPLEKD